MALEHGRFLELPADPQQRDLGLVVAGEVDALAEQDRALVGPGLAGDDIHHRRLAGTVGADDRPHLAPVDVEREIVQRPVAVERHRDAVEIEHRARRAAVMDGRGDDAHGLAPWPTGSARGAGDRTRRLRRSDISSPAIPLGRNSVVAMNRAPSAYSQISGKAPVSHDLMQLTPSPPTIAAPQGAAAAKGHPDHGLDRVGRGELARVDDAHLRHVEGAADAGEHGREGPDEQLEVLDAIAAEAGPALGVTDGDQHLAEPRGDDVAAGEERQREDERRGREQRAAGGCRLDVEAQNVLEIGQAVIAAETHVVAEEGQQQGESHRLGDDRQIDAR